MTSGKMTILCSIQPGRERVSLADTEERALSRKRNFPDISCNSCLFCLLSAFHPHVEPLGSVLLLLEGGIRRTPVEKSTTTPDVVQKKYCWTLSRALSSRDSLDPSVRPALLEEKSCSKQSMAAMTTTTASDDAVLATFELCVFLFSRKYITVGESSTKK